MGRAVKAMIVVFLIAISVANFVNGIVCPPGICATVRCESKTQSSCSEGQTLTPFAGYCGCCPACIRNIPKGQNCGVHHLLLGAPQTASCEPGTLCQKVDDKFICAEEQPK